MIGVATDIGQTFVSWRTWWLMASQDIRMRYKRSAIGPFWLSAAMAAQVIGIGLLYSQIFNQPLDEFLLYLGGGFLAWGLVAGQITDGSTILIEAEGHLRALRIPTPVLAARMVSRNLIIFMHNIVVIGGLMLFLGHWPTVALAAILPGLALIALFGYFLGIVLGPLCLRFRDVNQVIASLMGMAMFLTPIFWLPSQGRVSQIVVLANPLYHMIELIRAPLLGRFPTELNWIVAAGCVGAASVLALVSLKVSRQKIYFWL
jgi:lipopolysaccharide transport system permease protein